MSGAFDYRSYYHKWVDPTQHFANPTTGPRDDYPAYVARKGASNSYGDQVVKVLLEGSELRHVVRSEINHNNNQLAASMGVQNR